jgi:hypothetical protein
MKRFVHEVGYRYVFFFFYAVIIHINAPNDFAATLLYFYFFASVAICALQVKGNAKLLVIVNAFQVFLMFLMGISLLADEWCRFLLYRGHKY